jgi:hypothetical protein
LRQAAPPAHPAVRLVAGALMVRGYDVHGVLKADGDAGEGSPDLWEPDR